MTEKEIKAIETHTEIHARAEPAAIKITEILRKAVIELRVNRHLKEEMEIMTKFCGACKKKYEKQIEEMKCCGNCSHHHYWGNELGCNLDYDKEDECNHNNKKYWEFMKEDI